MRDAPTLRKAELRRLANEAAKAISARLDNPDRLTLADLSELQANQQRLASAILSLQCREKGIKPQADFS